MQRLRVWAVVLSIGTIVGLLLSNELLTPKAGVAVSRDSAPIRTLPTNARNVTYYIRPPLTYYEFDTDEAGFEEWAATWQLAWKDRSQGSRAVVIWDHSVGRPGELMVADAVGYGWWEEDAGWFLTYDRRSGRAYCSGNYR